MRYAMRTFVGLGLMVAAITVMSYSLYQLLQIGTCASGGPYVSARQCPDGTGRLMVAFFPAIVAMLAAAGLYASRGKAPGSDREGGGIGALLIIWVGLFVGLGVACLWGVWGPDANPGPGGKLGGLIVGFLFIPMGLAPLLFAVIGRGRTTGTPASGAESKAAALQATLSRSPGRPFGTLQAPAASDKLTRLERLNQLRRDGAVSDAEFERLKQEIVDG